MTILRLKSLFWTLLFISPSLCVADTTIIDIGSLQLGGGSEIVASKSTEIVSENTSSGLAIPNEASNEEEDCE